MKLFVFPEPPNAVCTLRHDAGWTETAVMAQGANSVRRFWKHEQFHCHPLT